MKALFFVLPAALTWMFATASGANADGNVDAATRLSVRLAEIDELQREVDHLRHELGQDKYLSVSFTELKVNVTKLSSLAEDVQFRQTFPRCLPEELHLAPNVQELEKELVRRRIAIVLSKSTLPTAAGVSRSFDVGGEVPCVQFVNGDTQFSWKKYGTHVGITGTPVGSNRIRLRVSMSVRSIDEARTVKLRGREWLAFNTYEIEETFEGSNDETFCAWVPMENQTDVAKTSRGNVNNALDEFQVVWLIRAHIADLDRANRQ